MVEGVPDDLILHLDDNMITAWLFQEMHFGSLKGGYKNSSYLNASRLERSHTENR